MMEHKVNKTEFANKLERYQKRQNQTKITFFVFGILFLLLTFLPYISSFFDLLELGYTSTTFAIFAGLSLGKAWHIRNGTEEHELLIDAMALLSSSKNG